MTKQYLTFSLNSKIYAINVFQVQEVLTYVEPTKLPCTAAHIEGLINSRNQGITVVNPGSITQPRQDGRRPTFCVCDVDPAGDLHFTVNYIKPDGSFATF